MMDETNSVESTDVETLSTEPAAMAAEGTDPAIPDESVPETTYETVPETTAALTEPEVSGDDRSSILETIYEELYGEPYEDPTEATEEIVIVEVIEKVGSDIVHTNLFSGFLIAGTLIGIFILRNIYGS